MSAIEGITKKSNKRNRTIRAGAAFAFIFDPFEEHWHKCTPSIRNLRTHLEQSSHKPKFDPEFKEHDVDEARAMPCEMKIPKHRHTNSRARSMKDGGVGNFEFMDACFPQGGAAGASRVVTNELHGAVGGSSGLASVMSPVDPPGEPIPASIQPLVGLEFGEFEGRHRIVNREDEINTVKQ